MKGFLLSIILSTVFATAYAQSDTLFWFVAPTASSGHGNSPILFRIAGGTTASNVTIDMPANPGFVPIVQAVGANAGVSIDVTPYLATFESTPASTILNKGIRIRSTSNISIYYEVNNGNNPEIYALKGDNALGTSFVTPFQNVFNNGAYTPTPKSAIDIVATEDGTVVTIVPSAAIVGGAAGVPITITLNKGQTYSVVQATTTGAGNLSGTTVTSNKRIAVTIKDDSLQFEGCMDLTGDQMVPTNIIGKEYIVVKGSLNVQDKVVIVPISPGTNISINGTPLGTYSSTLVYNLTVPSIYIEASAPVYVYHYTGFGCELGSAIVPPIKCTGARSMSAVRSTNEYFGVVVFALTSTVNNFLVNGSNTLLTSTNFTVVPGTGGLYSSALVDFSASIGTGTSINITNSVGLFHAGIINGGASSGCRYGFFSDYSRIVLSSQITKPISCFNGSDGAMMVEMIGGLAPYNYAWSNGQTTQTAIDLSQGIYKVVVTDASNCKDSILDTIAHPTIITGSVFPIDIINNCLPETSTGSAVVTATGGTPGYTYSLDSMSYQGANQFMGLAEGPYTALIKDMNGCIESVDFVILDPPNNNPIQANLVTTSVVHNCTPGGNGGEAAISVSGGFVPYTYSLNGATFGNDSSFTGLSSGNNYIIAKDANGCRDTVFFIINNPINNTPLTAIVSPSNITHNCLVGATGGEATVTISGGFTPYQVSLNNGAFTSNFTFNNLATGNYTIDVLDSNGCTTTTTFTITDPPAGIELSVDVLPTDIVHNCLVAGNDGTASATVTGGYTPYRYSLDGGVTQQPSPSFTNLASGTYTLTVTDTNNCTATATFTVTDPPAGMELAASVLSSDIVHNCLVAGNDGTALATVAGGYTPFRYSLDGGVTQQQSPSFANLLSGTYTLTVTDTNNCTATATFTVTDPPAGMELAASVLPSDIVHNCLVAGNDGTASATVTGGYTPYRYSIDGGTTQQQSPSFTGLLSGTYTLTVTDTNGCTATTTFTVTDPPADTELAASVLPSDIVHNCLVAGTDGTALATVTGGYTPYRYSLDGGATQQSSPSFANLLSGTYTLTVTDTNNCTATTTFTVTDPPAGIELSVDVLPTDIVHNCLVAGTDGTALATVTGGYTPYRYSLDGGVTQQQSPSFTGLLSGTYTLTVTDTNNCTATATFTITDPPAGMELAASVLPSDIVHNCLVAGTDGTALATVTGGYTPYRYSLDGGVTQQQSPSFTNLLSGTYTLTVTDTNNCTATATFTITDPPAGMELAASVLPSDIVHNCLVAGADGTALATVTGGYTPYRYSLDGGVTQQQSPSFTNLLSGTYTLTVTDTNNCTATATFTITDPPADTELTTSVLPSDIVHNCLVAGNDGTALATVTGGYTPYRYSLDGGVTQQSSPSFANLPSGAYTLTVTDTNNCTATATFTVTDPPADTELAASVLPSDIVHNCLVAGNDGTASATVTGGYTPYRYSLDGGVTQQSSPSFANLTSGTYTITVTDTNNCTATTTFTVTDPPAGMELAASVLPSDIVHNCFVAGNDGTALATVTGGYTPYRYSLDGGATQQQSPSFANLPSGTYTLTVTDTNNCTATTTFTVTDPPAGMELAASVLPSDIVHNCLVAGNDGTALATVTGGYTPYRYSLDGGVTQQQSPSFTGLLSGTYTLTVTDTNNCTATATFTITDPPAGMELAASVLPSDIVHNCLVAGTDGTALATVTGGYTPYRYSLDGGVTQQQSPSFTNLLSGTYTLTVTDTNNCTATATFTVTDPPAGMELAASVLPSDIVHNCLVAGNDGTASATVTGGYTPYRYSLDGGVTQQSSPSFANLASGTYTLTVTDTNNCTATTTFTVTDPPANTELAASVLSSDIVHNCLVAGNDGTASTTVTGGYTPYRYSLDGGVTQQSSPSFANLASGTYTLTVTDTNNCTATATFTVTDPPAGIELSVDVLPTDIVHNCLVAGTDGTALATVTGGYTPYRYSLDGGVTQQQSPSFTNLASGTYTLTVTDTNNCTTTTTFVVTDPAGGIELSVTLDIDDISCYGLSDGSINALPNGGYPTYTYLWDDGQTTSQISNLALGTYSVIVTDANGCQTTMTGTITQPAAPLSVTGTHTDVNCFGAATGTVTSTVSGGTAGYQYLWSNGEITSSLSNVTAGNYTLKVTDANGCTETTFSVDVIQPQAALALSSILTQVKCFQGNDGAIDLSVTGGTTPYQHQWASGQNTEDIQSLTAGNYSVLVTDANGCTETHSATITQSTSALTSTATTINPACNGSSNGGIQFNLAGGEPNYTYVWSNGASTQNIGAIPEGTYTVNYTDNRGCTGTRNFTLVAPTPIIINGIVHDNLCSDHTNGSISITANGGTPGYSYLWNSGLTQPNLVNLGPGAYYVTATDANGCSANANFSVFSPTPLEISVNRLESIFIGEDILLSSYVSGGTMPYQYSWTPEETLACPTCESTTARPVTHTNYFVYVTDANGCRINANVEVTVNQDIFIPNAFTPGGSNGINDTFKPIVRMAKECSFAIYNRWGEKIYSTKDVEVGWDGTLRGNLVKPDVYVYKVDVIFFNGEERTLEGHVTLIR
jgi:gliding motility-associated-like protein